MSEQMTGEQVVMDYQGPAIVECMGHQKTAGIVSVGTIAGAVVLRVDIPAHGEKEARTEFIHPNALYALSPCSEEAVLVALRTRDCREPVSQWDIDRYRRQTDKEKAEAPYLPHLQWVHAVMLKELVAHEAEKGEAAGWISEDPKRWLGEAQTHLSALEDDIIQFADFEQIKKHAAHICNFVMMTVESHLKKEQGNLGPGPWDEQ